MSASFSAPPGSTGGPQPGSPRTSNDPPIRSGGTECAAGYDLALLIEAAEEAGRLALELQYQGLRVTAKSGGSPVTNGDLAVNQMLAERLRGARPGYGWLSEESVDNAERLAAERLFIVDPIDGTTAYFEGTPWWTIAIAVVEDGRAIAGVVHAPALGETYAAAVGAGATLNGAPIRAGDRDVLEGAAMLAPMDTFRDPRWAKSAKGPWPAMRVERRNALTLRLALVGSGAFDAAVSLGPKHDWDLAPGTVIAQEAGAVVTDRLGVPFQFNSPRASSRSLICAGPTLHRLILERVAPIDLAD